MSEGFFLPASAGRRYCLFHRPAGDRPATAILYIHPFAEEMNKSRRMAALQARALAAAGHAVLQIDLHGCGDSDGDFGEASWDGWLDDIRLAVAWLRQRSEAPLWLWGLRGGTLLAAAAAAPNGAAGLLLWQPVPAGRQHLQQFLRLKAAGELLGNEGKGAVERLRQQLAAGETVEVAGYALSPALACGLDAAELAPPDRPCRSEWLELSTRPEPALSPAVAARIAGWQAAGHAVRGTALSGPAFWQTAEIETCPALVDAGVRLLGGGAS